MGEDGRETRILDAAEKLILHYGYDKTTVSDIAHEAGVSKGAIYLHYDSKDELFDALIWRNLVGYMERWMDRMEQAEGWTFSSIYREGFTIIDDIPMVQALMRNDRQIMGNYLQRTSEKWAAVKSMYRAELFEQMQAVGALRADLDLKVASYLMNVIGFGLLLSSDYIDAEQIPPLADVMAALGDMMDCYLLPEDGGNQEAGKQLILQMVQAFREHIERELDGRQP